MNEARAGDILERLQNASFSDVCEIYNETHSEMARWRLYGSSTPVPAYITRFVTAVDRIYEAKRLQYRESHP
jgi:hypothetical protein